MPRQIGFPLKEIAGKLNPDYQRVAAAIHAARPRILRSDNPSAYEAGIIQAEFDRKPWPISEQESPAMPPPADPSPWGELERYADSHGMPLLTGADVEAVEIAMQRERKTAQSETANRVIGAISGGGN